MLTTGLATIHLLRVLHVGVGVFWVGTVLFLAAFLVPSLRAAGPAGGAVMRELVEGLKMPLWLMAASVVTILSGIGLYWIDSAGFQSAWLASGPGRAFGLGGALALVSAVLGMAVNAPTARRLGQLAAALRAEGRQPTPEEAARMARLQARLNRVTLVVAVLLSLATLAMAVARYVP
jgi:hypothetical protein